MSKKLFLGYVLIASLFVQNSFGQTSRDVTTEITDLYAFRSPDDDNTVTIIANFIPSTTKKIGMSDAGFGENVRYEIHIENDGTAGDDITYRFTFTQTDQDPTTIFGIRLGQENHKTTYNLEKSVNGGGFSTIVSNGVVPPENIGNRSISDPTVGLGAANYGSLFDAAVTNASGGEKVFCGPADDPFFTNIGGFNDIANGAPGYTVALGNMHENIYSISMQIPISTLQKNGMSVATATNILDSDFIIGVWASTSRQETKTLYNNGTESFSGAWIQVSRIGMPLTDDMIIPVGHTDYWNSLTPYSEDPSMESYFCSPEMGLYMDNSLFGGAIPALSNLRIQRNTLQSFDFGNTHDGLWPIRATNGGAGTAVDTNLFGNYYLRQGLPRSFDLLPFYYTGIPNLAPYQLATGKSGNPLAPGKSIINNFLPTFGDMLRLNMAVPVTPRNSPDFSSLGLIDAMNLGLTSAVYNANANLEWIPNMDGFPNGRRLEDDVMRITLQLNSGIFLAAMGFWYDDYISGNPITQNYLNVLDYTTGIETNDTTFRASFPFVQTPWAATQSDINTTEVEIITHITEYETVHISVTDTLIINFYLTGLTPPDNSNTIKIYPNPASDHITINTGQFNLMDGYTLKIDNSLSQTVFTSLVNQESFYIDITTWTGIGLYFVYIIDDFGNIIDTRKIIIN
jgi:hypothetical protein